MKLRSLFTRRIDNAVSRDVEDDVESLRVVGVEVLDTRTAVMCEGASGPTTVLLPAAPTPQQAKRWQRTMRRVDRVEIHVNGTDVTSTLVGVSHRLPTRRRVPLSAAVALIADGTIGRVTVAATESTG